MTIYDFLERIFSELSDEQMLENILAETNKTPLETGVDLITKVDEMHGLTRIQAEEVLLEVMRAGFVSGMRYSLERLIQNENGQIIEVSIENARQHLKEYLTHVQNSKMSDQTRAMMSAWLKKRYVWEPIKTGENRRIER